MTLARCLLVASNLVRTVSGNGEAFHFANKSTGGAVHTAKCPRVGLLDDLTIVAGVNQAVPFLATLPGILASGGHRLQLVKCQAWVPALDANPAMALVRGLPELPPMPPMLRKLFGETGVQKAERGD